MDNKSVKEEIRMHARRLAAFAVAKANKPDPEEAASRVRFHMWVGVVGVPNFSVLDWRERPSTAWKDDQGIDFHP